MFSENDRAWMKYALSLAEKAYAIQEVPVGAVLIKDNQKIGEGYNQSIQNKDPTGHAEIIALRESALQLNNYRLPKTTLYVTLEPCAMCMGALIHARIERVVFATSDPRTGACGSVLQLHEHPSFNHRIRVESGLFQEESSMLLKRFFQERRL